MKIAIAAVAALFLAPLAPPAAASVVFTSSSQAFGSVAPNLPTETFASINPGNRRFNDVPTGLSHASSAGLLAGVTYTSSTKASNALFIGGPGAEGIANPTTDVFASYYGASLQLLFLPEVTAVGFDLYNYDGQGPVSVQVYGDAGLLATLTETAGLTPTFLGITSTAGISEVTLTPTQQSTTGVSDLSFGPSGSGARTSAQIPEPASASILGLAALGLAMIGIGRKARARIAIVRTRRRRQSGSY